MSIPYKYKIYWFEDNNTWLESEKDKLSEVFETIEFEINPYNTADNIDQMNDQTEIDIILMDYNLVNIKGNEIIAVLRDKNILCNIIFYSQDTGFAESLNEKDGIYTTARSNVGSELTKFVKEHQTIIENVSTLRGKFITGAVDLDEKMNDIIVCYLNSSKEIFLKEKIIQTEFFNTFNKYKVVKYIGDELSKEIDEKLALSSEGDDKEKLEKDKEKLARTRTILAKYTDDIIQVRNTLAHSKHDFDADGNQVFVNRAMKNVIYLIKEEWVRQKLNHLTTHSINLDRLKSFL